VTAPGPAGPAVAFAAELVISFIFMTMVLTITNTPRLAPFTGFFVAALVATYIVVESPLSGTSMNPARSLASALPAMRLEWLWIYVAAPPLGMLLAAETYLRASALREVGCAKLNHHHDVRCIFNCRYQGAPPLRPEALPEPPGL
jgi:aquaporin Z